LRDHQTTRSQHGQEEHPQHDSKTPRYVRHEGETEFDELTDIEADMASAIDANRIDTIADNAGPFVVIRGRIVSAAVDELIVQSSVAGQILIKIEDEWRACMPLCAVDTVLNIVVERRHFQPGSSQVTVSQRQNYIVLYPDTLVSTTLLADSFACLRRSVISVRTTASIEDNRPTSSLLCGSLSHELFGEALSTPQMDIEDLKQHLRSSIKDSMIDIHSCNVRKEDIELSLKQVPETIIGWQRKARNDFVTVIDSCKNRTSMDPRIRIVDVKDVEESIWSLAFGLKGKLDATVIFEGTTSAGQREKFLAPLELKTGKSSSSVAHRAQTLSYSLLLADKYCIRMTFDHDVGVPIEYVLLLYISQEELYRVVAGRLEITGLIVQRNRLAHALQQANLPPFIHNEHYCKQCFQRQSCLLYAKVYKGLWCNC
jgi:hypothetical protein